MHLRLRPHCHPRIRTPPNLQKQIKKRFMVNFNFRLVFTNKWEVCIGKRRRLSKYKQNHIWDTCRPSCGKLNRHWEYLLIQHHGLCDCKQTVWRGPVTESLCPATLIPREAVARSTNQINYSAHYRMMIFKWAVIPFYDDRITTEQLKLHQLMMLFRTIMGAV